MNNKETIKFLIKNRVITGNIFLLFSFIKDFFSFNVII